MRTLARVILWVDRGYEDGVARSNMTIGVILAVFGSVALTVENREIQWALASLAGAILILFGWRMLLSFRRQSKAMDRRRAKRR